MNKPDFSELEALIRDWNFDTVAGRIKKRTESTLDEMQKFHDVMLPRLEEIIKFLNRFPVGEIPEEYQALKNAALCMLHVDRPVNKWKKALLEEARDPRRFQMKVNFYDSGRADQ